MSFTLPAKIDAFRESTRCRCHLCRICQHEALLFKLCLFSHYDLGSGTSPEKETTRYTLESGSIGGWPIRLGSSIEEMIDRQRDFLRFVESLSFWIDYRFNSSIDSILGTGTRVDTVTGRTSTTYKT